MTSRLCCILDIGAAGVGLRMGVRMVDDNGLLASHLHCSPHLKLLLRFKFEKGFRLRYVPHCLPAELADSPTDSEPDGFTGSASSAEMQALRPRPTPASAVRDRPADLPLVLVVEDNPDMNRFVCSSLASEFRVASAFDGRQALLRLEHVTPDLIVTDFHDATHERRRVRARSAQQAGAARHSGLGVDRSRRYRGTRTVLSTGVQDWLTKPFTVRELVARARNLISARRARAISSRADLA